MTRLERRIVDLISAAGPITVADYMALCLFDPRDGYYTTRQPFGAAGDFVTAPEISQMFGELIAVWSCVAWGALGSPSPFTLAEIGPGRGTLMKDMLRTLDGLDATLLDKAAVALVETSPRLVEVQKQTLAGHRADIAWHGSVQELPPQPLIIVGNELFDAVPVRQFVKAGGVWRERMIATDDETLRFALGPATIDPALLPPGASEAPEGSVFETAPQRAALMAQISDRLAQTGGAALFIDYGHSEPGFGDTLQALRAHACEDVLASPGEADLTSHVDFAALAAVARHRGLDAHLATQGEFLLGMGLLERAGSLGSGATEAIRERITREVERLAGPDAMGTLFKVLAVVPQGVSLAPFNQG